MDLLWIGSHGMNLHGQELNSVLPDLRDLPLERLADLGDSVLAHSIALYRQRLKETVVPLSSFNARI
jgi:FXSXX-COOH protein